MKVISNRGFLLVSPKEPFIRWLFSHDDFEDIEESLYQEKSLYAVKSLVMPSEENILAEVKRVYKKIFHNELWAWYEDPAIPTKVSFEMFNEWFGWEYIGECHDTCMGWIATEKV